jgi:hypothetical protein
MCLLVHTYYELLPAKDRMVLFRIKDEKVNLIYIAWQGLKRKFLSYGSRLPINN